MSLEVWTIIGIVFVVVWGMIIWDIVNGPVYPDDYGEEAEYETTPHNEKSPPSSQTYSGSPIEYRHFKYPTTDCLCHGGNRDINHSKDCSWKSETVDYDSDYQKMRMEDQEWSQDNWDNGLRRIFNQKVLEQSDKIQELLRLQTQLEILHNSSDIAFDHGAQMEYHRIQERIEQIMGNSSKGVNNKQDNKES